MDLWVLDAPSLQNDFCLNLVTKMCSCCWIGYFYIWTASTSKEEIISNFAVAAVALVFIQPQFCVTMITRKCYNDHEDVNFRGLCGDVTMEDSFQPPLPDYYAPDAADQQKQIEEGYASDGYVSEDASYTSSISYVYSEEASSISSSGDGASEDADLANEVGDVASKDADSANEEGAVASIDGGDQMYDGYSNPDSSDEDTSDGDTSDDFTGPFETNFEKYDHMSDKEDDAYDKAMKAFKTNKPTKEDWIKTWPEGRKEAESAWVNVYSHFEGQGELGCGGYAVIVRNMSAQPIAASANFSKRGKSYFFHVLDGIQAGLRLASEHGCSSPDVRCSSRTVVMLLWQLASGGCIPFYENCKGTKKGEIGEICETCTMAIVPSVSKHAFVTSAGLLGELRGKLDSFDIEWEREMTNKAAQYLAKEVKKKALQDGIENYNKPDMKPDEFPDGLVSIMLDDAFDNLYYNRDAWTKIIRAV